MGRAGGWILGVVVVLGMAAAGLLGLRPILLRKTQVVEFVSVDGWNGSTGAGIQLAFDEKGNRAGRFKVLPGYLTGPLVLRESPFLAVHRMGMFWSAMRPNGSSSDLEQLFLIPHPQEIGARAALWSRKSGITRVFIIDEPKEASRFESGFRQQASSSGIDCRSELVTPQGRSLVEAVLAGNPEMVILGRSDAAMLIAPLRKSGYAGRFMVVIPWRSPLSPPGPDEADLEDALIVTCLPPIPASFAVKQKSPDPNEYYGYLMATMVLNAMERADSKDPVEIYRVLSQSSEFTPHGLSALPGGLYVVKKGTLQLVEPLK